MIFGGLAPTVSGCGKADFSNMSISESCVALKEAQNRTGCVANLDAQFKSLAYEVNLLVFCIKIGVTQI